MELDITCMLSEDLYSYSNSIANTGLENIGQITWNNALESEVSLVNDDNVEEIKDYIKTFGAWEREEIDGWSINETNALVIQLVSGDLQEYLWAKSLEESEYQEWERDCGGRIYECDIDGHAEFGRLFYYIGE